jgi:ABC-type uncharacterized transport system substrate-binding protein
MNRRTFLCGLTLGTLTAPLDAEAQYRAGKVPRVGILNSDTARDARVDEFRDGLRKLGYVEEQNLVIIYRWADGRLDRLPALVDDLLASHVDVIVAIGASVWAAKQKTSMVPIVMAFSGDPVGTAMVSNLARPGGNITGLSFMSSDLAAKRLELLKQTFPRIARVAVLYLPAEVSTAPELRETEAAARTIGVTLQPLEVRHPDDLAPLIAKATRERADALLVFAHAFAFVHRDRIVELSARQRLPTMFGWREFADVGGLMSYGPNVHAMLRRASGYVDRILKGAKPGDLPIEQPTTFELVINLKTAKALGLTIPQTLLLRADHVIE